MNPVMNPMSSPVRFGGLGRKKSEKQTPQTQAEEQAPQTENAGANNVPANYNAYKSNRFWQKMLGVGLMLNALGLGLNAGEAVAGENDLHVAGIEQTSNAVDIGFHGLMGAMILPGFISSGRRRKEVEASLNEMGYVLSGKQLIKVDDKA